MLSVASVSMLVSCMAAILLDPTGIILLYAGWALVFSLVVVWAAATDKSIWLHWKLSFEEPDPTSVAFFLSLPTAFFCSLPVLNWLMIPQLAANQAIPSVFSLVGLIFTLVGGVLAYLDWEDLHT